MAKIIEHGRRASFGLISVDTVCHCCAAKTTINLPVNYDRNKKLPIKLCLYCSRKEDVQLGGGCSWNRSPLPKY